MAITLHHHPFSRAANVVWMLEELEVPYELAFVDLKAGDQKSPAFRAINPMGKLPVLVDGDVVLTETAAIALYLGDRYASGTLAPALDDPARGPYLRWILFAPSVIEPGAMAHANKWEFRPGAAGWGTWEEMNDTIEGAVASGPWLLGERYTLADTVFGGTVRWMLRFGMIEARPAVTAYAERLGERPANQRAAAKNQAILVEHGLA